MTTENQVIEDEAAEIRAWKAALTVGECSTGSCIHNQTPEQVFRRGFRYGMAMASEREFAKSMLKIRRELEDIRSEIVRARG